MRYQMEIIVNMPRDRMMELFDSFDNLKEWQEGFVSYEHLSGEPGQPGARTQLIYNMGKRRVEMLETIITRNMPDEFSATYDASGVHNIHKNFFHDLGDTTRWELDTEFKFSGYMRILSLFMPGSIFKKQTWKSMEDFKRYAENA